MKKILVIDDSPVNLALMRKIFRKTEYTYIETSSGKDALTLLNDDPGIDLILLDVQMPDMNGYEVLEHLKSNNRLRHIPVIFVTACDFLNVLDYIKTLNDDAVSCISKPLDVSTLLETIDHFLCLHPHYLDNARIAYQMQKNAWVFSHTS